MKKIFFLIPVITLLINTVIAQDKIFTKTGTISFDATAAMDKIQATNNKATCVINTATGQMEFAVLMKGFEFEKALMEEHFNENYVESDKFPKSTFKGKINNLTEVNFAMDGTYPVTISGDLTIHGVTKPATAKGFFTVKDGIISGKSEFNILLSDYGISIPTVVKENISNETKITVEVKLDHLNQ
jgi:polyisoprenoid-binding protein YceI